MDDMQDTPDGKFCNICQKNVLDLSHLNQTDMIKILEQKRGEKFCGILLQKHLNRPIALPQIDSAEHLPGKYHFSKIAAGIALTASMLTTYPGQTTKHNEIAVIAQKKNLKGKNLPEKEPVKKDGHILFTGKVLTKKSEKPIITTVSFITIKKVYSTKTDASGNFILEIPSELIQEKNLLEFNPSDFFYNTEMSVFTKAELSKHQTIHLSENGYDQIMGDVAIGPPYATPQSFVILNGKVLDYKLFNKSYMIYPDKYEVYYIPKAFVNFFTSKDNIHDIYITFVKKK
ncbi:hypothetical protein [Chryseobacterium sp.]|jgi:hypothetical protein|uniref:hypothetical protein n=1 Tax=Chryseobacterium sp. TaxID=1871047 RepID=UPI00284FDC42|nr:hypothetical protein [Chryseobacterium sp.]MDR3025718.1 hypothetical protein [Chryseobacterium sp.]